MASITACSPSRNNGRFLWLFCLWLFCLPFRASAAEIDVSQLQIQATEDGYTLGANFRLELNQRLEEAVARGVVLHFVVDFEVQRPRWYWFDEKLLTRSQTYRLSYHALTRQYRLATGALHQSFTSLSDALQVLGHVRNWLVIEKADKGFKPGESYQAAVRMQLDVTQLPRPFQLNAIGSRDWTLSSDWKVWTVVLPDLAVETGSGASAVAPGLSAPTATETLKPPGVAR